MCLPFVLGACVTLCAAVSPLVPDRETELTLLVHSDEFTDKWVDRALKLGATRLSIHPVGGTKAVDSLEDLLKRLADPDFSRRIATARAKGLQVGFEMHAGSWLLPRALFAEHPEFFRMDKNGKRTPWRNFCLSSPAALDIIARRAVELAERLEVPDHRYFFWMDDCKGCLCVCPKCRELSASDQQLVFCNRVVTELRKRWPDAQLCYLAYYDTVSAPTVVRPEKGVFLEYAPLNRDMTKPLAVQDIPEAHSLQGLLRLFGGRDKYVLEYWVDNSFFSHWRKPPKKFTLANEVAQSDIAWYRRLGFSRFSVFACYLGDDYEALWGEPDISALAQPRNRCLLHGLCSPSGLKDETFFTCGFAEDDFAFRFEVSDKTPCAAENFTNKVIVADTDRVEVFFADSPGLTNGYYCAEVDPKGRVMDYQAHLGRQFDYTWRFKTLRTRAAVTQDGYVVSGRVSLSELRERGINPSRMWLGVFRGDYAQQGELANWYSAVPMPDPQAPNFHQPAMFFPFVPAALSARLP